MNNSVLQRITAKQSKRLKKSRNDEGFSLLELVTAVGVLLILVIIGFSSYGAIQNNSKQSATNKAVDEVYGKAFATLVDEDASTNPLQVQEEYNKSSKNVRVTVEELGNDRITVRAFLPNGKNGEEEFVATKTTPAVQGSEGTGTTTPVEGGDETTPPIIGYDTVTELTYKCLYVPQTGYLPIGNPAEDTIVTVNGVKQNLATTGVRALYYGTDLRKADPEEDIIPVKDYYEPITMQANVEYKVKIVGAFETLGTIDDNGVNSSPGLSRCLTSIDSLGDDSGIVYMGGLGGHVFYGQDFTVPENIPSSIKSLKYMFYYAIKFNQDISGWDVSNVENMDSMFFYARAYNKPLNNWDTRNVKTMVGMFEQADVFNQPLNNWDVSKVEDMNNMFHFSSAFDQDISDWDVSNVKNVASMFKSAEAFNNGGQDLDWGEKTRNLQNASSMFNAAKSFDQKVDDWNVSSLENVNSMFAGASSFNQPLNNWDIRNVKTMVGMLAGASSFNQPLNNWDVSKVENMSNMFNGASSFNQSLSNWDTSNVTNMYRMFESAASFNQNISSWNVSKVTNMISMFNGAASFDQNLGSWKVPKIAAKPNLFDTSSPIQKRPVSEQPQWGKV